MHQKRNKTPKIWPIPRKGTKYVVRAVHAQKKGIPLLIVLRNILKIAKDRKEAKMLLNLGKIKVNGKIIREEKFPLLLFDILNLAEKNFKLILKNKKFAVLEIKDKKLEKIVKVVGKKLVGKGKMQINLADGRNYLFDKKVRVGDSVVVDLEANKIVEVLPFEKGRKIMFIAGKHLGEEGEVESIDEKTANIKVENEKINAKLNNLIVIK